MQKKTLSFVLSVLAVNARGAQSAADALAIKDVAAQVVPAVTALVVGIAGFYIVLKVVKGVMGIGND